MTNIDQILLAVESATGVPPHVILSDNRVVRNSNARFLAMALFKDLNPWATNHDVALAVGKKDPSTGRHGLMRAAHLLETDPEFRAAMDRAKNNCEFS